MHNHHHHHAMMVADFKKRFFISLLLTLPVLLLSPMIQQVLGLQQTLSFPYDDKLLFAFSTFIFVYGGWPFLKGLVSELKQRKPGMMTLIAVAITVAYGYSAVVVFGVPGKIFFWELATLIDIMLLGHWIEMRSVMGASEALEALVRLMPKTAHQVAKDGSIREVDLESVQPNDVLLVKTGEKVPADGVVVQGQTSVNESMLTGESKLVSKGVGAKVIGGAINGEGSIQIKVEATGEASFLSKIIHLVKQAQETKSKSQDLANRAAFWLTIIALTAGAVTFGICVLFTSQDFAFSLERTVTVMVITCPHALGLAVPLVVAVSTSLAAHHGLLIRNRAAFERARNVQAVVFDKTGTLTQGVFGITDVITKDGLSPEILKHEAASIEALSEHPIAKAIAKSVEKVFPVEAFQAIPGKAAQGKLKGALVQVVSPGFLKIQGIQVDHPELARLTQAGKTVVHVLKNNEWQGAIALADIIRPESKEAVTKLKAMGIRCMMLTGDNQAVAKWVANEIGLDDYFAEVLPEEKSKKIKEIQAKGLVVAMTGDGINDAPALAQADVGIAIGAGTDVAIETADIILVKSNPLDVVSIFSLSRATTRKMIQNLLWATGYNVAAIPLAAGILFPFGIVLSPAVGAVLMSLSTVIVAINARWLKID